MSLRFALACHILAFAAGFLIDILVGDPRWIPHPVSAMGRLIKLLENILTVRKSGEQKKLLRKGKILVASVLLITAITTGGILIGCYILHPFAGVLAETLMTWQALAAKDLKVESMRVYACLTETKKQKDKDTLAAARKAVSMIVGRDTENLDEAGVIRAAVETVAENTSDGVIAPMLYLAVGGPILGFLYKAVNTMDSMVGYKNAKYLYFGRAAAKLDDGVNYIPARVSAGLMLLCCIPDGEADQKNALRIYRRDRYKHASPNSAQTEAVCAGALGVRLAGPASYFGKKVKKPFIGDARREIEAKDIVRANRLMMRTAWLCEALYLGVMGGILWLI